MAFAPVPELFRKGEEFPAARLRATRKIEVAVNLKGALYSIAGPQMKTVHILSYQTKTFAQDFFQPGHTQVPFIRVCLPADVPAVEIPGPDLPGVLEEHAVRGHFLGPVVSGAHLPVTFRPAKGGNAAFSRNPGAGEHRDPARGGVEFDEMFFKP